MEYINSVTELSDDLLHANTKPLVPVIDTHLHFVDFLQENEDGLHIKPLAQRLMTRDAGVFKAVVFGLPQIKKWSVSETHKRPSYYLDDYGRCYYYSATDEILARAYKEELTADEQKRIAPLVCGFDPTDLNAVSHIKRMLDTYPFFRGVGEIMLRHDDLSYLTIGETAKANHPALKKIYELCEQRKLPVLIHQNSSTTKLEHCIMAEPGHPYPDFEYLPELEQDLKDFPNLKIVWAHCGGSRRVFKDNYVGMVRYMLENYPNLHVDISWVIYDKVILPDMADWVQLIKDYQDRIMVGSDKCGKFSEIVPRMAAYNPLFAALSDDNVRRKIAYENAERMWFAPRPGEQGFDECNDEESVLENNLV